MHKTLKQGIEVPDAACAVPSGTCATLLWPIFAMLVAAAFVQAYAGFELLGLRWDGGPFLRDMLSAHSFVFYEQPRQTTQVILELPVVMARNHPALISLPRR